MTENAFFHLAGPHCAEICRYKHPLVGLKMEIFINCNSQITRIVIAELKGLIMSDAVTVEVTAGTHQHQVEKNCPAIICKLPPEILTHVFRVLLSGKKGIESFEALLLAYPKLQQMVLFVEEYGGRLSIPPDVRSNMPCFKNTLFKKFFCDQNITPLAISSPLLYSLNRREAALSIFIFCEFDESVKTQRLTDRLSSQYGRSIPRGSIIVSRAHDTNLMGHQSLIVLAKLTGSTLIHKPERLSDFYAHPAPRVIDGSSYLFNIANSSWVNESSSYQMFNFVRDWIRSVSKRHYRRQQLETQELPFYILEIFNCQHLRLNTLKTQHVWRLRIRVAPGCRSSNKPGECIALVLELNQGEFPRDLPRELTIEYESTLLPRISGRYLTPRDGPKDRGKGKRLTLRNKSLDKRSHGTECEHGSPHVSWSQDDFINYYNLTYSYQIFHYDGVPDQIVRHSLFMWDVVDVELTNLQPADPYYHNSMQGIPAPHPILSKSLQKLKISALVTNDSMHSLPRFLVHRVDMVILEELGGSDRCWDLEWLFANNPPAVNALILRNDCSAGPEFLKLNQPELEQIHQFSGVNQLVLDGYDPEVFWSPGAEVMRFAATTTLQIDITNMPVEKGLTGHDLMLTKYFPHLQTLKLSGRLSRSWKWGDGITLDITVPEVLDTIEIRPAVRLCRLLVSNSLVFDRQRNHFPCLPIPFRTMQWRRVRTSETELSQKTIWDEKHCKREVVLEVGIDDWNYNPDVYY